MAVDHNDARQESERQERRTKSLETAGGLGGGDSAHAGSGEESIQLGTLADASGYRATALGWRSWASGDYAVCLGDGEASGRDAVALGRLSEASGESSVAIGNTGAAYDAVAIGSSAYAADSAIAIGAGTDADGERSVAIGAGAQALADDEFVLGASGHHVKVPGDLTVTGTFSNPSARRLKQGIAPAPRMRSVFPTLYEWEYIARPGVRRIGPMADDLVGTDAERFLVRGDDGEPAGIETLGLHTAQIAALLDRIVALEEELRRRDG